MVTMEADAMIVIRADDNNDDKGSGQAARGRRGGPPGGGGGGPPDDGPGGNPNDEHRSPRRSRRSESHDDSDIEVADRTRAKGELPLKLSPLPKSAGESDGYQFAVINHIALASGRHQRRIGWIEATTRARHPSELEYVPRKNRSLD
jgi:hypothetical protein